MGSVAEKCQKMGHLAGSFFFSSFSGSPYIRSNHLFAATLAYQFQQHGALKGNAGQSILSVVEGDPAIFTKRLGTQVDALLLAPLRDCQQQQPPITMPMVIIIDGLDECVGSDVEEGRLSKIRFGLRDESRPPRLDKSGRDEQIEVLDCLLKMVKDSAFPFRILLASRPEPWIREFLDTKGASHTTEIFLDNKYSPDKDIELFLRAKFSEIRRRYRHLPPSWPANEAIAQLVENSSGQFIYAATVIRFIETPSDTPQVQLDAVLKLGKRKASNPLEPLYALYTRILLSVPNRDLTFFWLKAYRFISRLQGISHARFFNAFCESSAGEAQLIFGALPSLIDTRQGSDSAYGFYHKSFLDFLEDTTNRCQAFSHITEEDVQNWILGRFSRTLLCMCLQSVLIGCLLSNRLLLAKVVVLRQVTTKVVKHTF